MLNGEIVPMLFMVLVVGAVLGSITVSSFLKKKGINVDEKLTTVEKAINAVEPALAVAKGIAPLNPIVNKVDFIEKWAKIGVQKAEQLYHISEITTNDERKNAAIETVYAALKEFNIEPTENQQKLINDTIEAAVNDLGHKNKTDAEKETEKQSLQSQLVQAQKERDDLKKTVDQITAAAQSVQK